MQKKQVVAGFLATIFTFLSGGHTFAHATTTTLQSKTSSNTESVFCLKPFSGESCGKVHDLCIEDSLMYSNKALYTFVPQKDKNFELIAKAEASSDEDKKTDAKIVHSYEVAKATPTLAITTPTASPSPTVAVQAAYAVNAEVTPADGGLSADTIFSMVNQIRSQYGLAPLEQDSRICQLTQERAPELQAEIYVTGAMHAGFQRRQKDFPYWATENMISQQTEEQAVNWWMNSPVHRSAILGNYTHSCVSCSGNNCAMIFTNFTPKSQ